MKRRRGIVIAVGMLVILSLTAVVWAQVSTNFDLSWYILADGGGERQSANYLVQDTLGEWVGDTSSCGWHKVQTGFWYGVVLAPPIPCKVYVPLTLKNYWPGPWESEPNNDYSQANGQLRSGEHYFGYPNDTNDYFFLYLLTPGHIDATVTNFQATGQLVLRDENLVPLQNQKAVNGTMTVTMSGLPAGKYYLQVFADPVCGSCGPYSLTVTFP